VILGFGGHAAYRCLVGDPGRFVVCPSLGNSRICFDDRLAGEFVVDLGKRTSVGLLRQYAVDVVVDDLLHRLSSETIGVEPNFLRDVLVVVGDDFGELGELVPVERSGNGVRLPFHLDGVVEDDCVEGLIPSAEAALDFGVLRAVTLFELHLAVRVDVLGNETGVRVDVNQRGLEIACCRRSIVGVLVGGVTEHRTAGKADGKGHCCGDGKQCGTHGLHGVSSLKVGQRVSKAFDEITN